MTSEAQGSGSLFPSREPFVSDSDFVLYVGDVRDVLPGLVDETIDCCVTSPPYLGLRDYGEDQQIGLEASIGEYVQELVSVFRDVRRLLKPTGTLWLNLGDSYNAYNGGAGPGSTMSKIQTEARPRLSTGFGLQQKELKPKDLMMVPARVAIALQEDGWYIRSEIVWSKPNPMPESVTDRPTRSHEMVYLLSKSRRYHYDAAAIAERAQWFGPNGKPKSGPHAGQMQGRAGLKQDEIHQHQVKGGDRTTGFNERWSAGRPQMVRAMELAQQAGLTEAHFAAIKAVGIGDTGKAADLRASGAWGGTSPATETQRLVDEAKAALGGYYREFLIPLTRNARSVWEIQTMQYADAHFATFPEELPRRCILAGCPEGGTVLDPFMGSGTTAKVARDLGRNSVGVELNPEYAQLCATRLQQQSLLTEAAS